MTVIQKGNLKSIIANKGRCKGGCSLSSCAIGDFCMQSAFVDNFYTHIYKAAVQKYEEEFGREELVEVLL
jgi:hypothetical protein